MLYRAEAKASNSSRCAIDQGLVFCLTLNKRKTSVSGLGNGHSTFMLEDHIAFKIFFKTQGEV